MREFIDVIYTYPWTSLYATALIAILVGGLRVVIRGR